MSRRTLSIAALSAALAFAGGYALLDTLQPAGALAGAGSAASVPSKVVAVPGSALVPVGDGSTDWQLIGPDGSLLAGPDGRPPATSTGDAYGSAGLATTLAARPDGDFGVYLVNFVPEGPSTESAGDRHDRDRDEDDDHDDYDYDDWRRDRDEDFTAARVALPSFPSQR